MTTYCIETKEEKQHQYHNWRIAIKKFFMEKLPQNPGTLLEIGFGPSTKYLFTKYPNTKFDILDYQVGQSPKITIVEDLLTIEKSVKENSYDTVTCSEVLEHVKQPFVAVEKLIYVTKPGGLILITVPSFFWWHPMLPVCDDYWRFMPNSIPLMFEKHKVIYKYRHGGEAQPTGMCYIIEVVK